MQYYGLHFVGADNVPVQVRINTRDLQIWARSAPNGSWNEWRRLDVTRNTDGTLTAGVSEATQAKSSDIAGRLKYPFRITFTGDVSGSLSTDGSGDVSCELSVASLSDLSNKNSSLSKEITDLKNRISSLEERVNNLPSTNPYYGSGG